MTEPPRRPPRRPPPTARARKPGGRSRPPRPVHRLYLRPITRMRMRVAMVAALLASSTLAGCATTGTTATTTRAQCAAWREITTRRGTTLPRPCARCACTTAPARRWGAGNDGSGLHRHGARLWGGRPPAAVHPGGHRRPSALAGGHLRNSPCTTKNTYGRLNAPSERRNLPHTPFDAEAKREYREDRPC